MAYVRVPGSDGRKCSTACNFAKRPNSRIMKGVTQAHTPREYPRYPVRISCELTISGETLHAATRNVSPGGAAIVFSRQLSVGEVITVSFFLTQDGIEDAKRAPFECAASIRWTKPAGSAGYEAGMQFLSPSEEQKELLREFLRRTV